MDEGKRVSLEPAENPARKQLDIFDLTKYILSFFVVGIHSALFHSILFPWLRLAVPLFFIISSYLLCRKLSFTPESEKPSALKKYIIRNLILYAFWFVVLLPITIYGRRLWWDGNILLSIWRIVSNVLFSSSFLDSWFIIGCIIGSLFVFLLREKHFVFNLLIMLFCFSLVCFLTSYSFCFTGFDNFRTLRNVYFMIFQDPQYSFPIAIGYMLLGQFIFKLNISTTIKRVPLFVCLLVVALCFLYFEWRFIKLKTNSIDYSTYFSLPICSFFIFLLIKDVNIHISCAKLLRQISVITFVSHHSIKCVIEEVFARFLPDIEKVLLSIILFFSTILLCHLLTFLILRLEKIKAFRLLRFSH